MWGGVSLPLRGASSQRRERREAIGARPAKRRVKTTQRSTTNQEGAWYIQLSKVVLTRDDSHRSHCCAKRGGGCGLAGCARAQDG